ncbi:DUF6284 family protein [Streptomyces sp. NPDC000983]|uniref:DUF6284 family protein n=1 Tax=Streptomyces sp. NPDC000983 TaxID=3154373 RepID=UPI003328EB63
MNLIVTVQEAVTAFADFMEPTDAELDAIEREMPAILAGIDQIDAEIAALELRPAELYARRARRKVLATRVVLANRADREEAA